MTVLCPEGHRSGEDSEYCDVCGLRITGCEQVPQAEAVAVVEDADTDTSRAPNREPCPRCHSPRSADDRFCEQCRYDFLAPPSAALVWEAIATADREQVERHAPDLVASVDQLGERHFLVDADQLRIGRSRRGCVSPPEIDFAGELEDPGISRLHAVLERGEDGTYTLRDLGSMNGTTLNGEPVGSTEPVRVTIGDRIRIGAWTTITLRSGGPAQKS